MKSFVAAVFVLAMAGVTAAQSASAAKVGSASGNQFLYEQRQRMIELENALPEMKEGEFLLLDKFKGRVVAITGPKECVVAIINVTNKSKIVVVDGVETKQLTTDGAFPLSMPFKAGPTKSMGTDAYRILKPVTKAEIEKQLEVNTFRKWKGVTGTPLYKFSSADEESGKVTLVTEDGKKRVMDFKKLPKEEQEFAVMCVQLTSLLSRVK